MLDFISLIKHQRNTPMKIFTINLFTPIWFAVAIYAAHTGKVSWWTVFLIALYSIKVEYKLYRRY